MQLLSAQSAQTMRCFIGPLISVLAVCKVLKTNNIFSVGARSAAYPFNLPKQLGVSFVPLLSQNIAGL